MSIVSLRARLLVALAAATIASQFLRSSSGVIAPELVRDLALSPEMLGFANGCFFISLGLVQVPVGLLFDRVGVRSTYLALTGFAALGALLVLPFLIGYTVFAYRVFRGKAQAGLYDH